jgi:hypothetical protein
LISWNNYKKYSIRKKWCYLINSYQQPENSLAQGYSKSATNLNRPASQSIGSSGYMNTGKGGSSTYPANYSVYYYIKT